MQAMYQIIFENGSHESFYVNDKAGYFYGELWIKNPQILKKGKMKIADSIEFKDSTLEGYLNQIKAFVKDNTDVNFTIEINK